MPELVTGPGALLLTAILSYLLGSTPFGLLIVRAIGGGDVRKIGSGNIGATNVLRTGNKAAALATLLLDGGKAAVAVLAARAIFAEDAAQIAGLSAVLGHLFPVWLRFRGGKGVATFLGTALALAWPVGIAACLTWLAVAVIFRMSSLSALVAALLAPIWAMVLGAPHTIALLAVLAVLIFIKHEANIRRIIAGEEPKIGAGR